MGVHAIIGGQWGDEGKGKIVDYFSAQADVVARFQGGANAGHTVYINDDQFILHQVPSGILHQGTRCLLGTGMVIDPVALTEEIKALQERGVDWIDQIGIAYNAHLVLPVHKVLDGISEESDDERTIGTTRRGIGPTYSDRHARKGVPASALLDSGKFKQSVERHLAYSNKSITRVYGKSEYTMEEFWEKLKKAQEFLSDLVVDVSSELHDHIADDKNIIAEGAQGFLLDIDYGTYPYVTSSHPGTVGVAVGLGIPPDAVTRSTGIFKAYCTRVGEGPFPTELQRADTGEKLRKAGGEFGATTGRPRRCGWFDAVLGNYTARINGFTDICITKADVLDTFDEVKVCETYENHDSQFINMHELEKFNPVYASYPGWSEDIQPISEFNKLPDELISYLTALEGYLNAPIKILSTGPERSQIIIRD